MKTAASLGFLPRLESLRGLAAVFVVGYHAGTPAVGGHLTGLSPVGLFFVLSGFVLARSLQNNPGTQQFILKRFLRLLPASSAVVLLLAALHWHSGFYVGFEADFSPLNVLLNALMIRSDINGVMWSMTVECL